MNKIIIILLVLGIMIFPELIITIHAQALPPPHAPGVSSPIDGGVSILLSVGVLYGIRKLYKPGIKH